MIRKLIATLMLLFMLCPSVMGEQSAFLTFEKSGVSAQEAGVSFDAPSPLT